MRSSAETQSLLDVVKRMNDLIKSHRNTVIAALALDLPISSVPVSFQTGRILVMHVNYRTELRQETSLVKLKP